MTGSYARIPLALALAVTAGCASLAIGTAGGTTAPGPLAAAALKQMPALPAPDGGSPWGGPDASRWRPEAVMANAASSALNAAWALPNVRDVIVSVPTKMYTSDFHPYDDGQSNAAPGFESWTAPRPPLVATLVLFKSGAPRLLLRFDRALQLPSNQLTIHASGGDADVAATRDAQGDWVASWNVPADWGWDANIATRAALVHPAGWNDWFPLWVRMPRRPIPELLATVPASLQHFSDGKGILDHEGVSLQPSAAMLKSPTRRLFDLAPTSPFGDAVRAPIWCALASSHHARMSAATRRTLLSTDTTPFQSLMRHDFGGRYNDPPYQIQNIHASFPWNGQQMTTAVGRGWTWVAKAAPFKIIYTAFERRQPGEEASAPNGGVPTGGGWHLIGDPAETILNDLESDPVLVGTASRQVVGTPSGAFAYNLSDVATFRFLQPGEAFTTRQGDFHWFAFQQAAEVTTEEWVHPHVPDDQYDF